MIQGLAVGGEYGATATYMSEVATEGKRGFYSSFQYVTLIGGQLLASLLGRHHDPHPGHRADRSRLVATAVRHRRRRRDRLHLAAPRARPRPPRRTPARTRTPAASAKCCATRAPSSSCSASPASDRSCSTSSPPTCRSSCCCRTKAPRAKPMFNKGSIADLMTICLLIFVVMQPIAGKISDKIGRKNNMLIFVIGMIALPIPLLEHDRQGRFRSSPPASSSSSPWRSSACTPRSPES
jgi:hypothetical protein